MATSTGGLTEVAERLAAIFAPVSSKAAATKDDDSDEVTKSDGPLSATKDNVDVIALATQLYGYKTPSLRPFVPSVESVRLDQNNKLLSVISHMSSLCSKY
jgi:hypothetical protein